MTAVLSGLRHPAVTLHELSRHDSEAILAGRGRPARGLAWHEEYPTDDTGIALALLIAAAPLTAGAGSAEAASPRWWLHQIVVDGVVVGDIGFHGPPDPQRPTTVEIGYCVVPGRRGEGIATRACALLMERAWRDGAEVVLAEAAADNPASRAVLRHSGFRPAGGDRFKRRRG